MPAPQVPWALVAWHNRVCGGAVKRSAWWWVRVIDLVGEGWWLCCEVGVCCLFCAFDSFASSDSGDSFSSVALVFEDDFDNFLVSSSSLTVRFSLAFSLRRLAGADDEACPKLSRVCLDIMQVFPLEIRRRGVDALQMLRRHSSRVKSNLSQLVMCRLIFADG